MPQPKRIDKPKHRDPIIRHQIAIAVKTLRMSDVGAWIMGGMTKDEAVAVLAKYGR